jgi:hypothetical protein
MAAAVEAERMTLGSSLASPAPWQVSIHHGGVCSPMHAITGRLCGLSLTSVSHSGVLTFTCFPLLLAVLSTTHHRASLGGVQVPC